MSLISKSARVLANHNSGNRWSFGSSDPLAGIQGAIKALNGRASSTQPARKVVGAKHVMSAAARAKISKATKARWAKFRAEKNKKGKS